MGKKRKTTELPAKRKSTSKADKPSKIKMLTLYEKDLDEFNRKAIELHNDGYVRKTAFTATLLEGQTNEKGQQLYEYTQEWEKI